ncbi:MAG: hypothetical protein ACO1PI_08620 [Bacteroidota bacterium]
MPELTNEDQSVSQKIKDESAAAMVFCETVAKQNNIVLAFCDGLLTQALNTTAKVDLLKAVKSFEDSMERRVTPFDFKTKMLDDLRQKIMQDIKTTASPNQNITPLGNNAEELFTNSMASSMQNVLKAQEELFALAKAMTTMGITIIYNTDTAEAE